MRRFFTLNVIFDPDDLLFKKAGAEELVRLLQHYINKLIIDIFVCEANNGRCRCHKRPWRRRACRTFLRAPRPPIWPCQINLSREVSKATGTRKGRRRTEKRRKIKTRRRSATRQGPATVYALSARSYGFQNVYLISYFHFLNLRVARTMRETL